MKIKADEVVRLLVALGYNEATKTWPTKKLEDRVNKLEKYKEAKDFEVLEHQVDLLSLYNEILSANVAKQKVELIVDEPVEEAAEPTENGAKKEGKKVAKGTENKPAKANKSNGKDKPEKPVKEKKAQEVDRFGTRKGTKLSEINKHVGKKPLSMTELLEKAGFDKKDTCYNHFKNLIEKGVVAKDDNGAFYATEKALVK